MTTSLNRSLDRRLNRFAATPSGGARRPRAEEGLGEICRHLEKYIKARERLACAAPHLFGRPF